MKVSGLVEMGMFFYNTRQYILLLRMVMNEPDNYISMDSPQCVLRKTRNYAWHIEVDLRPSGLEPTQHNTVVVVLVQNWAASDNARVHDRLTNDIWIRDTQSNGTRSCLTHI